MVIQINASIAATAQDLILVQNSHLHMGAQEEISVIIFGADMSLSVHVDIKDENILNLGEGATQGLEDTTLAAETIYPITFTQLNKRFVLSRLYNGSNKFLLILQKYFISKHVQIYVYYILKILQLII